MNTNTNSYQNLPLEEQVKYLEEQVKYWQDMYKQQEYLYRECARAGLANLSVITDCTSNNLQEGESIEETPKVKKTKKPKAQINNDNVTESAEETPKVKKTRKPKAQAVDTPIEETKDGVSIEEAPKVKKTRKPKAQATDTPVEETKDEVSIEEAPKETCQYCNKQFTKRGINTHLKKCKPSE